MATFTPAKLAFVQLASTNGTIYDSGANIGEVHNIVIHNTNTTTEVVTISLHDGTNEYLLLKLSVVANDTIFLQFGSEGLIVDAASLLKGYTTTAAKVTCAVFGTTRS
jgi:hypothetical protein